MNEFEKLYDNAQKCYRHQNDTECKKDPLCGWYPGMKETFCYPQSLNQGDALTSFGLLGQGTTEYKQYKTLVEQDKKIDADINSVVDSFIERIENHRLINNFLYYLSTYEAIKVVDYRTLSGTILLSLISFLNNIIKENKIELTIDQLVRIIIKFIEPVRKKYNVWKHEIKSYYKQELEKIYTRKNNDMNSLTHYFTDEKLNSIFDKDASETISYNQLKLNIGKYLYDTLYDRTLGQESYLKQFLFGTVNCSFRMCTNFDIEKFITVKLLPLFGLETDEEFMQYMNDLIKPRFSSHDGKLYLYEYNKFLGELDKKIKMPKEEEKKKTVALILNTLASKMIIRNLNYYCNNI
jgi:hypothetical protein